MGYRPYLATTAAFDENRFMTRVYGWMSFALVLSAFSAAATISTPGLYRWIVLNRLVFFGLIIGELGLVLYLGAAITRMSLAAARTAFVGYSLLNGLTLSVVFLAYTSESIGSTFLVTAATFGALSMYGYVTKRDLTRFGSFLFMGLVGIVIASLVNIFLRSDAVYFVVTYIGVIVFVGLTAYDTQKIKAMGAETGSGEEEAGKVAVLGALALYLDFVNLFLMLLRLLGRRRN
ncbi:MAG: Bax inhibitor-1/YccA family protein [Candidatus Deferrimicrobiaceae bacterium]